MGSMVQLLYHQGLVLSKSALGDYSCVNLGKELAAILQGENPASPAFPIKAYDSLKEILNENIHTEQQGRRYLAVDNFAILFEPALKINLRSLVEDYAKRVLLILCIDHLPESSDAYFPFPEDKSFRLDLTGLNYTTLA